MNMFGNMHCAQGALVLAAGKGTRMHSPRAKVMRTLLGEPMITLVLRALTPLFADNIWTVIGHDADNVRNAFVGKQVNFVEQKEQLGTGHALMTALPALQAADIRRVLVINGDTPLITPEVLRAFLQAAQGADMAFATLILKNTATFGRVARKNGKIAAIVEAKDYDAAAHGPEPNEINAGLYALNLDSIAPLLPKLTTNNKNQEFYLTDLVALGLANGFDIRAVECGDDINLLGINTPGELVVSENALRQRIIRMHLDRGVIMHNPDSICLGPEVVLEPGVELFGPCEIYGASALEGNTVIQSHCVIMNSNIKSSHVREFCHIDQALIKEKCVIGPYARLRPGAVLEQAAHVGNFVEIKNSTLAEGAKANHLSYVGDSTVGAGANIGAGVITCNYDGVDKHRTTIGKGAFIGSNASLVAPVTIGSNAVVGAGSAITRNVPDEHLGIARDRQKNLPWKRKGK
jgi:bifunctional UDP-N-acetylglucosamine pyrophosphorylase/glucosamine-1-phosphate N-acetyltransferase